MSGSKDEFKDENPTAGPSWNNLNNFCWKNPKSTTLIKQDFNVKERVRQKLLQEMKMNQFLNMGKSSSDWDKPSQGSQQPNKISVSNNDDGPKVEVRNKLEGQIKNGHGQVVEKKGTTPTMTMESTKINEPAQSPIIISCKPKTVDQNPTRPFNNNYGKRSPNNNVPKKKYFSVREALKQRRAREKLIEEWLDSFPIATSEEVVQDWIARPEK